MAKQKHFPIFDDQYEVVAFLTDEQLGSVVRAVMRFMRNGTESTFDGVAGMFYQVLRAQYIRQWGFQWNGSNGGRPPKETTEKDGREEITPVSTVETPVFLREDNITKDNITGDKADSLSHSTAKPPRLSDEDFKAFWKEYPRKESKAQAKTAFTKVNVSMDELLQALETQKRGDQWRRDGGQYIPYASTWLNQRRWEDEMPAQAEEVTEPVADWTREHPDWADQSTWVCDVDGVYKPREACQGACG